MFSQWKEVSVAHIAQLRVQSIKRGPMIEKHVTAFTTDGQKGGGI